MIELLKYIINNYYFKILFYVENIEIKNVEILYFIAGSLS
jgi:hypothetical protein